MSTSHTTTDHETIRKWAKQRQGSPAIVKGTESEDGEAILRIEFRDGGKLQDIGWEEFFKIFEDRGLAFLYQDKTKDGEESRFFKFVTREKD